MEPLKCSICGGEAAVHLQQVIGGTEQSIHLCTACARNYGVLPVQSSFSITNNVGVLLFGGAISAANPQCFCRHCHCTLESFKKDGHLGCAQCYDDLKDDLFSLLENLQKSLTHVGKKAKVSEPKAAPPVVPAPLKDQLKTAIAEERFEDAAKIRDQLRTQNENH
jgi:protein arginine kinase activator